MSADPADDRVAVFLPLTVVFRSAEIDAAGFVLYARALADLSRPLLEAAVSRAIRTRTFFPTIAELRQDAETCRVELCALLPFVPCLACRDHLPGWMTIVDPAGTRRLDRCSCWREHQRRLAGHGLSGKPVYTAFPAPAEEVAS